MMDYSQLFSMLSNAGGTAGAGYLGAKKGRRGAKGQFSVGGGGGTTGIPGGNRPEGSYEIGKRINAPGDVDFTQDVDPSTLVGQFNTSRGVSEQPVIDTRGFMGKIFRPNTAREINSALALDRLSRENLMPTVLAEAQGKADIETKARLQQLENEMALKEPYLAVANNFNEPGEVPYQFAGDPTALLGDRENQPFVPHNAAGVAANIAYQKDISPNVFSTGSGVFKTDPRTGETVPLYMVHQGFDRPAGFVTDAKGNVTPTPAQHIPGRIEPQILGNVYGPGRGGAYTPPSTPQVPGALGGANTGMMYGTKASEQTNTFPIGVDGNIAKTQTARGEAPTTPEVEATGLVPAYQKFVNKQYQNLGEAGNALWDEAMDLPANLQNTLLNIAEKIYRPPGGFSRTPTQSELRAEEERKKAERRQRNQMRMNEILRRNP